MRALSIFMLALGVITLLSCQASILPFFSPSDEVAMPAMSGTWEEIRDDSSSALYSITGDSTGYQVIVTEEGKSKEYETHAFKLGDKFFLDIVQEITYSEDALDPDLFLQKHLVGRIIIWGDSMHFGLLNDEWCAEMIDDDGINVPYVEIESGYLLTGNADQMRPILMQYGDDPDAFPLTTLYRRGN